MVKMREIGATNKIDVLSVIQYVIDGIDDTGASKMILYGATNYKEFKAKLRAYECMNEAEKSKKKDGKSWTKFQKGGEASSTGNNNNKHSDNLCFSCGDMGHISTNCEKKSEGTKCFRCKKFGHKSRACKENVNSQKELLIASGKTKNQKMRKTVTLMEKELCALIDTGSSVNIVTADVPRALSIAYETNGSTTLKTAGDTDLRTMGRFNARIKVDGFAYETRFFVVADLPVSVNMILGQELFDRVEMSIKNNEVTMKPIEEPDDDEDNFLMQITVDERDELAEVPKEVRKLIDEYKPRRQFESTVVMKIQMLDDFPVYQPPRRLGFKERDVLENQLKEWIDEGIVVPCTSEYASPVVMVRKKDGTRRVCIDYRQVNKRMVKDRYLVPIIESLLNDLQRVFTTLDLRNGFFHVRVDEGSRKYLSFVTSSGTRRLGAATRQEYFNVT